MIPVVHKAPSAALAAGEWDISAIVADAAARAERKGKPQIALWMTADNCPGCLMLKAQIVGDASDRLYEVAVVVQLEVGDVRARLARTLKSGDVSLTTPGVPTIYMLQRAPGGESLQLAAVSLGPLSALDAHGDIKKVIEGTSRWVPEAGAAQIQACQGGTCLTLDASNRFHAPVVF